MKNLILVFLIPLFSCMQERKVIQAENQFFLNEKTVYEIKEIFLEGHDSPTFYINNVSTDEYTGKVNDLDLKTFSRELNAKKIVIKDLPVEFDSVNFNSLDYEVVSSESGIEAKNRSSSKERSVGVIIVNTLDYQNTDLEVGNSIEHVSYQMMQVKDYFSKNPSRKIELNIDKDQDGSPDVFVVDLKLYSHDWCDSGLLGIDYFRPAKMGRKAKREFKNKFGKKFKEYDHQIFVLPSSQHMSCGKFSGMATAGKVEKVKKEKVWTLENHKLSFSILVHELGHNFGLRHSSGKDFYNNLSDYGDQACPMGNSAELSIKNLYNPVQLAKIGSIPSENMATYKNHQRVGYRDVIYKIKPYWRENFYEGEKVVIKLPKKETGHKKDLYIHYIQREYASGYLHWEQINNFNEFAYNRRGMLQITQDIQGKALNSLLKNSRSLVVGSIILRQENVSTEPFVYKNIAIRITNTKQGALLRSEEISVLVDFPPFQHLDSVEDTDNCKKLLTSCTKAKKAFYKSLGQEKYLSVIREINSEMLKECKVMTCVANEF